MIQKTQELEKQGFVFGSSSINPFDPPRSITTAACGVISLVIQCKRRGQGRQMVAEIGVWQALTSRWLLTCLPGIHLTMVDPFKAGDPEESWYKRGDRFAKKPQSDHDVHLQLALALQEQFSPRVSIIRKPSVEAAQEIADGSLDLAFIDGAHDYNNVKADIAAWFPKIRPGGFLSGHDYRPGGNYFGLIAAVEESTAEFGMTLQSYPGKVWAWQIPG